MLAPVFQPKCKQTNRTARNMCRSNSLDSSRGLVGNPEVIKIDVPNYSAPTINRRNQNAAARLHSKWCNFRVSNLKWKSCGAVLSTVNVAKSGQSCMGMDQSVKPPNHGDASKGGRFQLKAQ